MAGAEATGALAAHGGGAGGGGDSSGAGEGIDEGDLGGRASAVPADGQSDGVGPAQRPLWITIEVL